MNRYKVIPGRIMMPKPDKDTDKRPDKNKIISLMNIDTNVLKKILEKLIQSYPKKKKKRVKHNDYVGFI